MNRYTITSDPRCVPADKRKAGLAFEVIDRTHPSDGGPQAIAWFPTEGLALNHIRDIAGRNDD